MTPTTEPTSAEALSVLIDQVEIQLAAFYGFAPQTRAAAHLLDRAQLRAALGDEVIQWPEYRARAGVFLRAEPSSGDLFIGLHLGEQIRSQLSQHDPLVRLDEQNLDGFCILVEEISHFHLLLNRQQQAIGVSRLELEWQGEVDKLVVAALFLEAQVGDQHLLPLARMLYDSASIVSEDVDLYWQATRHAAQFWYAALRTHLWLGPPLQSLLRQSYAQPWQRKMEFLAALGQQAAS